MLSTYLLSASIAIPSFAIKYCKLIYYQLSCEHLQVSEKQDWMHSCSCSTKGIQSYSWNQKWKPPWVGYYWPACPRTRNRVCEGCSNSLSSKEETCKWGTEEKSWTDFLKLVSSIFKSRAVAQKTNREKRKDQSVSEQLPDSGMELMQKRYRTGSWAQTSLLFFSYDAFTLLVLLLYSLFHFKN